jgi:Xaa-Pro aminopeptidase
VGFEEEYISISEMRHLRGPCPRVVSWKPHSSAVEALRAVKDEGEANCLKEAAGLACRVLMETLPLVKPGAMELDIAAEIDYRMRRLGASGPAFETIVASGARSALPHARPTSKRLRKNELVVLDLGAILRHYSSDLTRTVYLGRPPGRVQRLFQAVREAQSAAIAAIRPGATGAEVDGVARRVLEGHRLAHYFTHSLGHGIGLEIHEAPRLAAGVKQPLVAGNVLTVEPGVYLPGFGGFRIEDDVLITPGGAEVLTRSLPEIVEP